MAGKIFVTERTFISLYFQQWKPTFLYPQTPTTRVGRWEREIQRQRETERGDRNRRQREAHPLRSRVKQLDRQWDTHRENSQIDMHTHMSSDWTATHLRVDNGLPSEGVHTNSLPHHACCAQRKGFQQAAGWHWRNVWVHNRELHSALRLRSPNSNHLQQQWHSGLNTHEMSMA